MGTAVVLIGLVIIVSSIVKKLIKDRKNGKSACGCSCKGGSGCNGNCCK